MTIMFADLSRFVKPRKVAVIGASSRPGSQGKRVMDNLRLHSHADLILYPVNPSYTDIDGIACAASISELPVGEVDVALLIVRAEHILDSLRQCVDKAIVFAIIMSSGFAEAGEAGRQLQAEITRLCKETGLRVYGPNCPGFINLHHRIGMTFSPAFSQDLSSGGVGLVTQGGGLGRNILQGLSRGSGVSMWFSAGNEADLGVPDFVAWLARDEQTRVIALLLEGNRDGRRLAQALALARQHEKPVVALKMGRSAYGRMAVKSHTAALAGSSAICSGMFAQHGVVEVQDVDELVAVARLFDRHSVPASKKIGVFGFSGGAVAFASDMLGVHGLELANLSAATQAALKDSLPSFAAIGNPVDATGEVLKQPGLISACLQILAEDEEIGAILFPIPMDYGEITAGIAQAVLESATRTGKLIVPVWMSRTLGPGFEVLDQNGLQPFFSVSSAVSALAAYLYRGAVRPAMPVADESEPQADAGKRYVLDEYAVKQRLRRAGMPVPQARLATSAGQAAEHARQIGFPVVLKIVSPDIAHKTDVGGVCLNLDSAQAVAAEYDTLMARVRKVCPQAALKGVLVEQMMPPGAVEMLVGVHREPGFGRVMTLGLGGVYVEILKDVRHRLLPLARQDAFDMMNTLSHADILDGVRGAAPRDKEALADVLLAISDLFDEDDTLIEAEFNPVWLGASGQGVMILDALLVASR